MTDFVTRAMGLADAYAEAHAAQFATHCPVSNDPQAARAALLAHLEGAGEPDTWTNFNNLMHVTDWLIDRGLAKFTRTEETDGPLAPGLNITDSIEAALPATPTEEKP